MVWLVVIASYNDGITDVYGPFLERTEAQKWIDGNVDIWQGRWPKILPLTRA